MTEREYRADPRLNVSNLVNMLKSPREYKWFKDNPKSPTPAMQRGTMGHCYILEPAEFNLRYSEMPAFEMDEANATDNGKASTSKATKYYKAKVAAFLEENAGCEIISRDDRNWCINVAKSFADEPKAMELLNASDTEVVLFGEIEGVGCKCRLDMLAREMRLISDIKFTPDVSKHAFGSKAARFHMAFRMAFYREIARQNGVKVREAKLIAIESAEPFDCVVYPVREPVLDSKFDLVCQKIRELKQCEKTGIWPGYSRGEELELEVPMYDMEENDELVEWSA